MRYHSSHLDRRNLSWFDNDVTHGTLVKIQIVYGSIRGLSWFEMSMTYPISAIAGVNGSGKSTILALAACAYHNMDNGFILPGRKIPYYTMSDFFIQSIEEQSPAGIKIWYEFLHNRWRQSHSHPEGIGRGLQSRSKRRGGKWSNYSRRVKRNTAFFGIERVVPHAERSVSKSYRRYFHLAEEAGFEDEVREAVGRILGRQYDRFWFREHSKYRLPHVKRNHTVYSGFNMGAGENALFDILSTIYAAPKGLLILVDEIELGLHNSAQRRFIEELKRICLDRHCQVICTTHSPAILDALPPEGRFLIERHGSRTVVTPGVSAACAAGRLAEQDSLEIDVFVEDGIARQLIQSGLAADLRRRVNILPIGSAKAVVRQMAARFKNRDRGECVAVLDGDQRANANSNLKYYEKMAEVPGNDDDDAAADWFEKRLAYLPGDLWPEGWVFRRLAELDLTTLASMFKIEQDELLDLCQKASGAGKHREFYTLAKSLSLPDEDVCCKVCHWLGDQDSAAFGEIIELVNAHLE